MSVLGVVQHQSGIHPSQVPGSVTLGIAPTSGNVIVAALGLNLNRSVLALGSGWIPFEFSGDPTGLPGQPEYTLGVYHYVTSGDTAVLPAFAASGTTYWTHALYEVSGVSGNWANDLLFSAPLQGWNGTIAATDINNTPLPAMPAIADGSLALTFVNVYNGTVSPTVSGGSWTLDESANNSSNYGSVGAASRQMNNNDVIGGTWNAPIPSSQPAGGFTMMLTSAPPTAPYPRHAYNWTALSAGFPTTTTLPWIPTVGSLWIAFLDWGFNSTNPTLDTNFLVFDKLTQITDLLYGLDRYVTSGDVSSFPNIATSGLALWSVTILELAGVPASFADAFSGSVKGQQFDDHPFTTTALTTSKNNQLGIIHWIEPTSVDPPVSSTWTRLVQQTFYGGGGGYGATATYVKFFPTAGSTVQGTITPTSGTGYTNQGYLEMLFSPPLVPPAPPTIDTIYFRRPEPTNGHSVRSW